MEEQMVWMSNLVLILAGGIQNSMFVERAVNFFILYLNILYTGRRESFLNVYSSISLVFFQVVSTVAFNVFLTTYVKRNEVGKYLFTKIRDSRNSFDVALILVTFYFNSVYTLIY